jgi:hypothetical protein
MSVNWSAYGMALLAEGENWKKKMAVSQDIGVKRNTRAVPTFCQSPAL